MLSSLSDVIINADVLSKGYIERAGYIFTALTYPYNVYDALVIRYPIQADVDCPCYAKSMKSLEEHMALVNKYKLEKAVVISESLEFIKQCPSLKYMHIIPAIDKGAFDFSPLYDMPEIRSLTCQD